MHFHLPKPLHGWREFVGEVGIIVLGVLIALATDQAVQSLRLRQDTNAAREQLRRELVGAYQLSEERIKVRPCLDWQVDRLEDRVLGSGNQLEPIRVETSQYGRFVYRAPSRPWPAHVFENVQNAPVYAQFSEAERELLGTTYTQLHDMQLMNNDEDTAVGMLMVLGKPLPLDAGVKAHLVELLETERRRADLMAVIAPQIMQKAVDFGAQPDPVKDAAFLRTQSTLGWCRAHGF